MVKRHKLMDKVFWVSLLLIMLFAWMDVQQVRFVKTIDSFKGGAPVWEKYWEIQQPAVVTMWYGVLLIIALIWYLYSKDYSEAVALFVSTGILIFFGTQDLIYYFISGESIPLTMGCWANALVPVRLLSDLFGECCPTATTFVLSGVLGVWLSYRSYKYFQGARW